MGKILLASFKLVLTFIVIGALAFGGFMAFMTITDLNPKEQTILPIENVRPAALTIGQPFRLTTFNIGYCGLGANQDFFLDGGRGSGAHHAREVLDNLERITAHLTGLASDFIFIQEVDLAARRSYGIDEWSALGHALPTYARTYAINYDVPFVPVPWTKPMGGVVSGLAAFSKFQPSQATRYQLPGKEDWPRQLFELDRCFLELRIPLADGHELVVINAHLSAYDEKGKIRKQQLAYLKQHIIKAYEDGKYVVLGGDFNHLLPGAPAEGFLPNREATPEWVQPLPADFTPPGFHWAVDATVPSVRSVSTPWHPGVNYTTIIDGFIVSPNVEILSVHGDQMGFAASDHNPVTATLRLIPAPLAL